MFSLVFFSSHLLFVLPQVILKTVPVLQLVVAPFCRHVFFFFLAVIASLSLTHTHTYIHTLMIISFMTLMLQKQLLSQRHANYVLATFPGENVTLSLTSVSSGGATVTAVFMFGIVVHLCVLVLCLFAVILSILKWKTSPDNSFVFLCGCLVSILVALRLFVVIYLSLCRCVCLFSLYISFLIVFHLKFFSFSYFMSLFRLFCVSLYSICVSLSVFVSLSLICLCGCFMSRFICIKPLLSNFMSLLHLFI